MANIDISAGVDTRPQKTNLSSLSKALGEAIHRDGDASVTEKPSPQNETPLNLAAAQFSNSSISRVLGELGLQNTHENQALALLTLLQGLSLNKENLNFLKGNTHKISYLYKRLLDGAGEGGFPREAEELKDLLPNPNNLAQFLKEFRSNIDKIATDIIRLNKLMGGRGNSAKFKNVFQSMYNNFLLQFNNQPPFFNIQIPIMIKEEIYPWQAWYGKERDVAYLEFVFPRLGEVGCLLENWKSALEITFYCRAEFNKRIEAGFPYIKDILDSLGLKYKTLKTLDITRNSGVLNFLTRFQERYRGLDITL